MSALTNIVRKELKELMTPATFLPIIIMAIIFGSMGNTIGGIEGELKEKPVIGYINADNDLFSKIATNVLNQSAEIIYESLNISDKENGLKKIQEENGVALIIIPKNFSENILLGRHSEIEVYWVMKGAGLMDSISSSVVEGLISVINRNITMEIIQNNVSVNATTALEPTYRNDTTYFKGKEFHGLSPGQISSILSQQSTFIPIVIMMIIIISGGTVISSMALEKENKTLETLLTLPVNRFSIVSGKIIASALVGLILAVIYMFGLGFYMQSFQLQEVASSSGFDFSLSSSDLILVGLSIFFTLIAALSFCMLLGTLAKNYKSAQTLTFPVTLLALIPMFITMFKDFDTLPVVLKWVVFAIPFSHPMMAPRALIFDDYFLVITGIIYVSIFALIMIAVAVWVFKTDRLLTGSTNQRWKNLFRKHI